MDATAEQPRWQAYVDRLGSFCRLIRFDLRGIGLSDPLASSDPPTVEQWAGDALAVLDDLGVEQRRGPRRPLRWAGRASSWPPPIPSGCTRSWW